MHRRHSPRRPGNHLPAIALTGALALAPLAAVADPFVFSTGDPDGSMATASRPASVGMIAIETGDDFVLTDSTSIDHASFTGLLAGGATLPDVGRIVVGIYRVFPDDSASPPSGSVPTRVNSPADARYAVRDSAASTLSFAVTTLSPSFTAMNSVVDGIHPIPSTTTGGEGAVTGIEVSFDVTFATPFDLAPDHYFFVPQVQMASGEFLWLSAARPTVPPGTPFAPDLQSWIRNDDLAPDWLRVGTDIVGSVGGRPAPMFNAVFSLRGETSTSPSPAPVPLPVTLDLLGIGALAMARSRGKAEPTAS